MSLPPHPRRRPWVDRQVVLCPVLVGDVPRPAVRRCSLSRAAVVLTAGPVSAHSALQSSTPADQAELVQPPTAVTLTFNEAVDSEFSDVVVTGPDGQARQEGATQVQAAPSPSRCAH